MGLTLIETLLALIMLSLLIVGLLGLLGSLLVSSTKVSDHTAGTYAAQFLLEKAASGGAPPAPDGGFSEGTYQLLNHETVRPVDFHYRLDWSLIGEPAHYTLHGAPRERQFGTRFYHVKCTVWWMVENPEDGRAEGGGRRTLSLERFIKVNKRS